MGRMKGRIDLSTAFASRRRGRDYIAFVKQTLRDHGHGFRAKGIPRAKALAAKQAPKPPSAPRLVAPRVVMGESALARFHFKRKWGTDVRLMFTGGKWDA
jgi:hypothetical protein